MEVAQKIKVHRHITEGIKEVLSPIKTTWSLAFTFDMVIFKFFQKVYDPKAWVWPAVPLWWYQKCDENDRERAP